MVFHKVGAINYYTFNSFENQGLYQAVFTRQGGYSPTPWHSLNFGASVGDNAQRVAQNREIALRTLNVIPDSVYDLHQVHSNDIVITEKPLLPNEPHVKADAILTNKANITLMMRYADCVPILLFDPITRVIGISHAGWIGTINQIVRKTVLTMVNNFGTNPANVIAALGPSIGPDHYSVGRDVVEKVQASFGNKTDRLIIHKQGKTYFDLWQANYIILNEIGVTNIEVSEICTCCNLDDWYSHRGEHGITGRFGVIFGLSQ